MLENHMVIGDYYEESGPSPEPDEDAAYERLRDEADYDSYIDSKLDEWRETGVRPSVLPYRGRA
jgi:hypothetical protein